MPDKDKEIDDFFSKKRLNFNPQQGILQDPPKIVSSISFMDYLDKKPKPYGIVHRNSRENNIFTAQGLNFPSGYGMQAYGVIPTKKNPYFKGVLGGKGVIPVGENTSISLGGEGAIGSGKFIPKFGLSHRFDNGGQLTDPEKKNHTVVYGGMSYANPEWMQKQWETAGLSTDNVTFLDHTAKPEELDKLKEKYNVNKIFGYSAGGSDVWGEIQNNADQYDYIGLIDPTTSKYTDISNMPNVHMASNSAIWKSGYPNIYNQLLKYESGDNPRSTTYLDDEGNPLSHKEIPLRYFQEYKKGLDQETLEKIDWDKAGNTMKFRKGGTISSEKARKILHDGTVHGNPITDKQRRFFGAMSHKKTLGGPYDSLAEGKQSINFSPKNSDSPYQSDAEDMRNTQIEWVNSPEYRKRLIKQNYENPDQTITDRTNVLEDLEFRIENPEDAGYFRPYTDSWDYTEGTDQKDEEYTFRRSYNPIIGMEAPTNTNKGFGVVSKLDDASSATLGHELGHASAGALQGGIPDLGIKPGEKNYGKGFPLNVKDQLELTLPNKSWQTAPGKENISKSWSSVPISPWHRPSIFGKEYLDPHNFSPTETYSDLNALRHIRKKELGKDFGKKWSRGDFRKLKKEGYIPKTYQPSKRLINKAKRRFKTAQDADEANTGSNYKFGNADKAWNKYQKTSGKIDKITEKNYPWKGNVFEAPPIDEKSFFKGLPGGRFRQNYSKKDQLWLLNNLAQAQEKQNPNIAKYGGKLTDPEKRNHTKAGNTRKFHNGGKGSGHPHPPYDYNLWYENSETGQVWKSDTTNYEQNRTIPSLVKDNVHWYANRGMTPTIIKKILDLKQSEDEGTKEKPIKFTRKDLLKAYGGKAYPAPPYYPYHSANLRVDKNYDKTHVQPLSFRNGGVIRHDFGSSMEGMMGGGGGEGGGGFSTADMTNKGVDAIVNALGGDSEKGWAQSLSGAAGAVVGYFTGDMGGMIDSGGDVWGGIADYADEDSGFGKVMGAMESSSHAVGNYMQGDIAGGAEWTGETIRDTGDLFNTDKLDKIGDTADKYSALAGTVGGAAQQFSSKYGGPLKNKNMATKRKYQNGGDQEVYNRYYVGTPSYYRDPESGHSYYRPDYQQLNRGDYSEEEFSTDFARIQELENLYKEQDALVRTRYDELYGDKLTAQQEKYKELGYIPKGEEMTDYMSEADVTKLAPEYYNYMDELRGLTGKYGVTYDNVSGNKEDEHSGGRYYGFRNYSYDPNSFRAEYSQDPSTAVNQDYVTRDVDMGAKRMIGRDENNKPIYEPTTTEQQSLVSSGKQTFPQPTSVYNNQGQLLNLSDEGQYINQENIPFMRYNEELGTFTGEGIKIQARGGNLGGEDPDYMKSLFNNSNDFFINKYNQGNTGVPIDTRDPELARIQDRNRFNSYTAKPPTTETAANMGNMNYSYTPRNFLFDMTHPSSQSKGRVQFPAGGQLNTSTGDTWDWWKKWKKSKEDAKNASTLEAERARLYELEQNKPFRPSTLTNVSKDMFNRFTLPYSGINLETGEERPVHTYQEYTPEGIALVEEIWKEGLGLSDETSHEYAHRDYTPVYDKEGNIKKYKRIKGNLNKRGKEIETQPWSAATISYLITKAGLTPKNLKAAGFNKKAFQPNAGHWKYIQDALRTTDNSKYKHNAYSAANLTNYTGELQIGDILFTGRESAGKWSYDRLMQQALKKGNRNSYNSHTDVIVSHPQRDENGDMFYYVAGGNTGGSGGWDTYTNRKKVYFDENGKYVKSVSVSAKGKESIDNRGYKGVMVMNPNLRYDPSAVTEFTPESEANILNKDAQYKRGRKAIDEYEERRRKKYLNKKKNNQETVSAEAVLASPLANTVPGLEIMADGNNNVDINNATSGENVKDVPEFTYQKLSGSPSSMTTIPTDEELTLTPRREVTPLVGSEQVIPQNLSLNRPAGLPGSAPANLSANYTPNITTGATMGAASTNPTAIGTQPSGLFLPSVGAGTGTTSSNMPAQQNLSQISQPSFGQYGPNHPAHVSPATQTAMDYQNYLGFQNIIEGGQETDKDKKKKKGKEEGNALGQEALARAISMQQMGQIDPKVFNAILSGQGLFDNMYSSPFGRYGGHQYAHGGALEGDPEKEKKETAKEAIMRHEGTGEGTRYPVRDDGKLEVYLDGEGYPTVGWGHRIFDDDSEYKDLRGLKEGDAITRERAREIFEEDYTEHAGAASKIPGYNEAPEILQNALIDLTFNMGPTFYKKWPSFAKAVKNQDWPEAGLQLQYTNPHIKNPQYSDWWNQTGKRAEEIVGLFSNYMPETGPAIDESLLTPIEPRPLAPMGIPSNLENMPLRDNTRVETPILPQSYKTGGYMKRYHDGGALGHTHPTEEELYNKEMRTDFEAEKKYKIEEAIRKEEEYLNRELKEEERAAIQNRLDYIEAEETEFMNFWNPQEGVAIPDTLNKAKGGYMQYANGGGMPQQLTEFNGGFQHDDPSAANVNEGIPQGMAPDGQMNVVQPPETKLNSENYIFSDDIKVDKAIAEEFGIPKRYVGKTYADVSKKFNRSDSKREGDVIEENTKEIELERLMTAQEAQKTAEFAEDMGEMVEKYPEYMQALMAQQQPQQQGPSPEEQAMMQQQGPPPGPPQGMPPQGGMPPEAMGGGMPPMMGAYGGKMYPQGGQMQQSQGGEQEQIVNAVAQALQQGMPPEEVMGKLVEMGIPEEQAGQLIQGVMQQMQPQGAPKMKGGYLFENGTTVFKQGGSINIKPSKRGTLRAALGTPKGQNIPVNELADKPGDSKAMKKKKLFARNARKWKHATGGHMYANGGFPDLTGTDFFNTGYGELGGSGANINPNSIVPPGGGPVNTQGFNDPNQYNIQQSGWGAALEAAPMAYNIYQGLKKPDYLDKADYTQGADPIETQRMNIQPQLSQVSQSYAGAKQGAQNVSGGNAAAYMGHLGQMTNQESAARSGLYTMRENDYLKRQGENEKFNAGLALQKGQMGLGVDTLNMRADAARQASMGEGLTQGADIANADLRNQMGMAYLGLTSEDYGGDVSYQSYLSQLFGGNS